MSWNGVIHGSHTPFELSLHDHKSSVLLKEHHIDGFDLLIFQKGFLGLWGERVDSIEYYKQQMKHLEKNVSHEFYSVFSLSTYHYAKLSCPIPYFLTCFGFKVFYFTE